MVVSLRMRAKILYAKIRCVCVCVCVCVYKIKAFAVLHHFILIHFDTHFLSPFYGFLFLFYSIFCKIATSFFLTFYLSQRMVFVFLRFFLHRDFEPQAFWGKDLKLNHIVQLQSHPNESDLYQLYR